MIYFEIIIHDVSQYIVTARVAQPVDMIVLFLLCFSLFQSLEQRHFYVVKPDVPTTFPLKTFKWVRKCCTYRSFFFSGSASDCSKLVANKFGTAEGARAEDPQTMASSL